MDLDREIESALLDLKAADPGELLEVRLFVRQRRAWVRLERAWTGLPWQGKLGVLWLAMSAPLVYAFWLMPHTPHLAFPIAAAAGYCIALIVMSFVPRRYWIPASEQVGE